jgi:hypothetical protein
MAKDNRRAELKAARRELERVAERDRRTGNRDETPEYQRANRAVRNAERALPWAKRW